MNKSVFGCVSVIISFDMEYSMTGEKIADLLPSNEQRKISPYHAIGNERGFDFVFLKQRRYCEMRK